MATKKTSIENHPVSLLDRSLGSVIFGGLKKSEYDSEYESRCHLYQARSWGFWKGVRIDINIYKGGLLNTSAENASL